MPTSGRLTAFPTHPEINDQHLSSGKDRIRPGRERLSDPFPLKASVPGLARRARMMAADGRGNIVVMLALAAPVMLMLAGGAIDYGVASLQKTRLQSAVDAAAVSAARELHVVTTDQNQVQAAIRASLSGNLGADAGTVSVTANVTSDPLSLSVTLSQPMKPMFLFKEFSGNITVNAVARVLGGSPLCVLGLEDDKKDAAITLEKNAHLTGNACAVYSNSTKKDSIKSNDGALLEAEFICTAGGKIGGKGNFDPEPLTDCPKFEDPLADRAPPPIGPCMETDLRIGVEEKAKIDEKYIGKLVKEELKDESGKEKKKKKGSKTSASDYDIYNAVLSPGVYCGGLKIGGAANVRFEEGVYIMKDGPLYVSDFATIEAEHAGFYFSGKQSNLYFGPNTRVSLTAPKDGPMAGLLVFEDRDAPKLRDYAILSDGARVLEGTIYLPQSKLYIDADAPIADQSAYTAIIARRIALYAGPHLVLNTDYDLTDVPVPEGIGNNRSVILSN